MQKIAFLVSAILLASLGAAIMIYMIPRAVFNDGYLFERATIATAMLLTAGVFYRKSK